MRRYRLVLRTREGGQVEREILEVHAPLAHLEELAARLFLGPQVQPGDSVMLAYEGESDAMSSADHPDWRQTRQCSVEGCEKPAAHQLVAGAAPDRSFFWLCAEHWLAGPVRVVTAEEADE
jgi:hypothetical protein